MREAAPHPRAAVPARTAEPALVGSGACARVLVRAYPAARTE